jgi:hypothetical protein
VLDVLLHGRLVLIAEGQCRAQLAVIELVDVDAAQTRCRLAGTRYIAADFIVQRIGTSEAWRPLYSAADRLQIDGGGDAALHHFGRCVL